MENLYELSTCELISKYFKEVKYWKGKKAHMNDWTPNQIFNSSPTGEQGLVTQLGIKARLYYKMYKCDCCDSRDITQITLNRETLCLAGRCKDHIITGKIHEYTWFVEHYSLEE